MPCCKLVPPQALARLKTNFYTGSGKELPQSRGGKSGDFTGKSCDSLLVIIMKFLKDTLHISVDLLKHGIQVNDTRITKE